MTDPQDRCAHCHHDRNLHDGGCEGCSFLKADMTFCACSGFVERYSPEQLAAADEIGRALVGDLAADLAERLHELGEVTPDEGRAISAPARRRGPFRAPPRVPPLEPERVEQIKREIAEMRAVQTRIYHVGLTFPHGEWQAFATLVSVFASMAEIVLEQGYDYAYEAECAVVPEFKGKYLGEKFRRVFGPFYGNERWVDEFLTGAGLRR